MRIIQNIRTALKVLSVILVSAFISLSLSSCVKETRRGDSFEATLVTSAKELYDGDEFSFTIKTNHKSLKVVSFDFPLAPSLVRVGQTYSTTSGEWTVSTTLSINETNRGRLMITVEDVDTGAQLSFEAIYYAYAGTDAVLMVSGPRIKGTSLPDDYSVLVDGKPVTISIRSSAESLIVEDFDCEWNGVFERGQEITFEKNMWSFTLPSVDIPSDRLDAPMDLSVRLRVPDTDRTYTVKTGYYKLTGFMASASLKAPLSSSGKYILTEGELATMEISSNRDNIKLSYTERNGIIKFNGIGKDGSASRITIGPTGSNTYTSASAIHADMETEGVLTLLFEDDFYTGDVTTIDLPYQTSGDASLTIDNAPAGTTYITNGLPTVVEGDNFTFTVRSHAKALRLQNYVCEFNNGTLKNGELYGFNDIGEHVFTIPKVSFQREDYSGTARLSLTFLDEETGKTQTLTANYNKVFAPEFTVTFNAQKKDETYQVNHGDRPSVTISSNRPRMKVDKWFTCTGPSLNLPSTAVDAEGMLYFNAGQGVKVESQTPMFIHETSSGRMTARFIDTDYSGKTIDVEFFYKANSPEVRSGTFGGYRIAPLHLLYDSNAPGGFTFSCERYKSSYGNLHGKQDGATFFHPSEVESLSLTISGKRWFLPSMDNFGLLFSPGQRTGSTYTFTNSSGKRETVKAHYASVSVAVSGQASRQNGFLFFPDDKSISGKQISSINKFNYDFDILSQTELEALEASGCVFIPAFGGYTSSDGWWGGNSISLCGVKSSGFYIVASNIAIGNNNVKEEFYAAIWLFSQD